MLLVFILGFGPLNSVTQTYRVWIWVGMEMRILHGTELSELDPIPDSPQWLCPPAPRVVVVGGCCGGGPRRRRFYRRCSNDPLERTSRWFFEWIFHQHMCWDLNSLWLPVVRDGHQAYSRGLYTHCTDSLWPGGMTNIRSLDVDFGSSPIPFPK